VQALSLQNRVLGLVGALETGTGLWYFTNGHWLNGSFYAAAVALLVGIYVSRERKSKRQGGGRRY